MKKILFAIIALMLLSSCGVGNYSISSGKPDEGELSFTTARATHITVTVDDSIHHISSVADKAWKTDRKIRKTANNTLFLSPGTHDVKVSVAGNEIFAKKLFISASEHKVIEL